MFKKEANNIFFKKTKAFTLTELLIVIAIIGILAGVVFVSTDAARKKAKDAVVIQSAKSMAQAAMADSFISGDWQAWRQGVIRYGQCATCGGFFATVDECNLYFSGDAYGTGRIFPAALTANTRAACISIINNTGGHASNGMDALFMGTWGGSHVKLSIAAYLPGADRVLCIGSNGKISMTSKTDGSGCGPNPSLPSQWACPGCTGDVE